MIELKKTVKLDGCISPKEVAKVEKEGKIWNCGYILVKMY